MKAKVIVSNVFTSAGKAFKGDIVDLPQAEIDEINNIRKSFDVEEAPKPKAKSKAKAKKNEQSVH